MLNYSYLVDITPDYPFTAGTSPNLHPIYWRHIVNFCRHAKGQVNKHPDNLTLDDAIQYTKHIAAIATQKIEYMPNSDAELASVIRSLKGESVFFLQHLHVTNDDDYHFAKAQIAKLTRRLTTGT